MASHETEPWCCSSGEHAYSAITANIELRVCATLVYLYEGGTMAIDNGFMANIHALRIVREGWPEGSVPLGISQVDFWERAYLDCIAEVRRFPKGIDREQYKTSVLEEFARLQTTAVPIPQYVWLPDSQVLLRNVENDVAKKYNNLVLLKQDWAPCQFTAIAQSPSTPSPLYSLTFSNFDAATEKFSEHGLDNDGYTWTKLVRSHMREEHIEQATFDPESEMFSVASSKLPILELSRKMIYQLIHNPSFFDGAASKIKNNKNAG